MGAELMARGRIGFRLAPRSIVRVIVAAPETITVEHFGPGTRRQCEQLAERLAKHVQLHGVVRRVSVLPLRSLYDALSLSGGSFKTGGIVPRTTTAIAPPGSIVPARRR